MLNGKEPKIVNGPEILNKYVGASEENVRNLFKVRSCSPAVQSAWEYMRMLTGLSTFAARIKSMTIILPDILQ